MIFSKIKPIINKQNFEIGYDIERKFGFHPVISRILAARGMKSDEKLEEFLYPRLSQLPQPDSLPDFEKVMERLIKAVSNKEKIGLFGDYDVDGIGSVALWHLFLDKLNTEHFVSLASREDGYGFTVNAVKDFVNRDVSLIIACDLGSTDYEACEAASAEGIDVIIVDHHQINKPYPKATAIVNPLREDSEFPFTGMATGGLSFYILAAFKSRLKRDGWFSEEELPDVKNFLDIAAMTTLSDAAPLYDVNRILVYHGLRKIKEMNRPSIKVLFKTSGIRDLSEFNEQTVTFKFAPQLNAPGRMGNAMAAFEFLVSKNYEDATEIAAKLRGVNRERQKIQEKILDYAMEQARASLDYRKCIVVSGENWHPGVVGIIAAKLAEYFKRPAFVISLQGDLGRGSVRSYGDTNVYRILQETEEYLIAYGGHEKAAGLEIKRENIGRFANKVDDIFQRLFLNIDEIEVEVDAEVNISDLDYRILKELALMSPFGNGNPKPLFYTSNLEILSIRFPKQKHLSLILKEGFSGRTVKVIGFNMSRQLPTDTRKVNIIYNMERDYFRGSNMFQLNLKYIWPS